MKSMIASLRSLTLPFGSTSGARIVLDGVNGEIRIYDDNDALLMQLDDEGFRVFDSDGDVRLWLAIPGGVLTAYSFMEFLTKRADQTEPGIISVHDTTARNRMVITPGENNDRGAMELTLVPEDGSITKEAMIQAVCLTLDHANNLRPTIDLTGANSLAGKEPITVVHDLWYGEPLDFGSTPTLLGSYGRGIVSNVFNDATADVARAPGLNTDMGVSFDATTDRLYKIHISSQLDVGTAAAVYVINFSEGGTVGANDGTVITRVERISAALVPAGSITFFVHAAALYEPGIAGTKTVRVRNSGASGGTIRMTGAAFQNRQLWVEDIGLR